MSVDDIENERYDTFIKYFYEVSDYFNRQRLPPSNFISRSFHLLKFYKKKICWNHLDPMYDYMTHSQKLQLRDLEELLKKTLRILPTQTRIRNKINMVYQFYQKLYQFLDSRGIIRLPEKMNEQMVIE